MLARNAVDISIAITAHNEGLVAHKTMLSIEAAIANLQTANISYEVIISIDNGDSVTKSYFEKYSTEEHYRVLEVDFRDLSDSRNNVVSESSGRYIAFLDADDLVSSNWLLEGYRVVSDSGAIAHPEYSVTFGDDNLMWQKRNSNDLVRDTLCLIDNNLWDSPCMAARDIFLAHPYHPNGNGYGYEDKHFNSQTLAAGIMHKVAPKTILFVRRKAAGSMLRQASGDLVTVAPTQLMSYESIRNLRIDEFISDPPGEKSPKLTKKFAYQTVSQSKTIAMKLHRRAKKYELYTNAIEPLRKTRHARIADAIASTYPKWMIAEWRRIHKIDNQIFPSKDLLQHLPWYNAENITPGIKYTQLVQKFTKKPDTLFFVPHLIKGGADMLFINYSTEIARIHPDWHIAMLQTEKKESIWKDKVSKKIDFIDLYKTFNGLDTDTQHRLLATLVTQNDIQRIVIGNSQLAYDFVSRYQTLITRRNIAIYCFAFGEEFDDEGRLWGHIHTGIPRIYPVIHRIITDNKNTVNKLNREYAFSREKFRVHYQPTGASINPPTTNDGRPLRVLWASRVCKQKRPDLLKAISNKLESDDYVIDAYGQLEEGLSADYFADSRVNYKGSFDGSENLPTRNYDVFLYTSEGDGVPNILQEMTAAGLPIVASNVGGISEFIITNKTGMLIDDHENIDDYVQAIQKLTDTKLRQKLHDGARNLLATQFSHKLWKKNILKDFDL